MPEADPRHVRYPNHYVWLLLVSSLDIFSTYIILQSGGYEANPLAGRILDRFDLPGLVLFKFAVVTLAIVIAETVGRRDERKGRKFAEYAIVISAFPTILACVMVWTHHGSVGPVRGGGG